jgi:hypothetical protein
VASGWEQGGASGYAQAPGRPQARGQTHRINLEVEFGIQRLAPEACCVAVGVNNRRQGGMDRSMLVDVHVLLDDLQGMDRRVQIRPEGLKRLDDRPVLLADAPDSLPSPRLEVGFAGKDREARTGTGILPVEAHQLVSEVVEGRSPIGQHVAEDQAKSERRVLPYADYRDVQVSLSLLVDYAVRVSLDESFGFRN